MLGLKDESVWPTCSLPRWAMPTPKPAVMQSELSALNNMDRWLKPYGPYVPSSQKERKKKEKKGMSKYMQEANGASGVARRPPQRDNTRWVC